VHHALHQPVLLDAAIAALGVNPCGCYLDATFGRGGHALAIHARLGNEGRLIAIDRDPQAVVHGQSLNWRRDDGKPAARVDLMQSRFAEIAEVLDRLDVPALDGVLFDLGVSSPQLDDPARGFSFRHDGPLDMRMNPNEGISARQWLLQAEVEEVTAVLRTYGEERHARAIALAIKDHRERLGDQALRSTGELAELVRRVLRRKASGREEAKDLATRSFQAIRMQVNQELAELDAGLEAARESLKPGGVLAVISFHSLEDRKVKHYLAQASGARAQADPVTGVPEQREWPFEAPRRVLADALEVERNPRARSAVLRYARKRHCPGR
jgi:16S rRNA (cytosine1402-N4)-methyltransferase